MSKCHKSLSHPCTDPSRISSFFTFFFFFGGGNPRDKEEEGSPPLLFLPSSRCSALLSLSLSLLISHWDLSSKQQGEASLPPPPDLLPPKPPQIHRRDPTRRTRCASSSDRIASPPISKFPIAFSSSLCSGADRELHGI